MQDSMLLGHMGAQGRPCMMRLRRLRARAREPGCQQGVHHRRHRGQEPAQEPVPEQGKGAGHCDRAAAHWQPPQDAGLVHPHSQSGQYKILNTAPGPAKQDECLTKAFSGLQYARL